MTVLDLIEKLKEMPQDAIIVASQCYEDYSIETVEFTEKNGEVDGNKSYVLIG